jgi:hypothetical protein
VNTIDDSLRAAIHAAANDCNVSVLCHQSSMYTLTQISIADDVVQTVGDRIVDMKTTQTYFDNFEVCSAVPTHTRPL